MRVTGVQASLAELLALRDRARELRHAVRRRSADRNAGQRHSPFRGRGMDYAESRPYAAGDDVRHIDWRVTARTGSPYSKLYQAERERVTAVLVDTSATMDFGTRACFKRVQAARLAALMAWHADGDGDRLAAAACGRRGELLPPLGARRAALRVLAALAQWSAGAEHDDDMPLARSLDRLGRVLRPGSHVLMLLDHRSLDEDALQSLGRLRRHHDLLVALLADPIELAAPPPACYPVFDRQSRRLLALHNPALRAAWQTRFAGAIGAAHERLRRAGLRSRSVATDEDPVAALRALLRGEPARSAA